MGKNKVKVIWDKDIEKKFEEVVGDYFKSMDEERLCKIFEIMLKK